MLVENKKDQVKKGKHKENGKTLLEMRILFKIFFYFSDSLENFKYLHILVLLKNLFPQSTIHFFFLKDRIRNSSQPNLVIQSVRQFLIVWETKAEFW